MILPSVTNFFSEGNNSKKWRASQSWFLKLSQIEEQESKRWKPIIKENISKLKTLQYKKNHS
jgi:hypothetical protein